MSVRKSFLDIKSYEEFSKYYWYREELVQICKSLCIDSNGTKLELNHNIEEYFKGNIIPPKKRMKKVKMVDLPLTETTGLVECGFCFNQHFRDFFIEKTGNKNFKFNADMVATKKKVMEEGDISFTLGDMLDIYYGKKEYVKFDKSACQWNQFLKDFCNDPNTKKYSNQLKAAAKLWSIVRESTRAKVYNEFLLEEYDDLLMKE